MVLKIRSLAIVLPMIMLFSGVICGEEYSNLLLGGIRQEAPCVDCSKATNLNYYAIANDLKANYFPMYYDDNELDNIGEVQRAATGEATDQNGLNNNAVHERTYDTILAYSGGTATALTVLANYDEYGVTCDTLILVSPMSAGISDELLAKIRRNIEENCRGSYTCPNLVDDLIPAAQQTTTSYASQVRAMLESDPSVVNNIIVITSPQDELMPFVSDIFQVRNFEKYTTERAHWYSGVSDINPNIPIITQEVPLTQYEDDGVEAHIQLFFGYAKTHLSNTDGGVIEFNPEGNPVKEPNQGTAPTVQAFEVTPRKWSKTFGGTGNDQAYSVHTTSDGGYIFAGETGSIGAGGQDAWLVKTDSQGNEIWSRTFGGTDDDVAYSIQLTPDEGYIIAGITKSFGAGGQDAWLIKTDSQGNEVWRKTLGGWNDDSAYSIQLTSDGGYIISGDTKSFSAQGKDALHYLQANGLSLIPPAGVNPRDRRYFIDCDTWLIKTDANGNEIWNRTFGKATIEWIYTGYDDSAYSVQLTSDGGYILAGGTPFSETRIVKTDDNGNEIWNKTFTGPGYEAYSVYPTSDGGYIMTGRGSGAYHAWLIKTDADGNELWKKTFGDAWGLNVFHVQPTSDGGYILAGSTELIKTDVNGNKLWNETFDEGPDEGVSSICPTSDGGYILAGSTTPNLENLCDAGLIKIAST